MRKEEADRWPGTQQQREAIEYQLESASGKSHINILMSYEYY